MTRQAKIVIVGVLILFAQLICFSDYIMPFQWGQIKVSGMECTCPDESVVSGELYLRFITPDSLKAYHLDYSEIYVSERPATSFDPMGDDNYIIKGSVIGKDRVCEGDPWNPKVKVESWKELDILKEWCVKAFLAVQFVALILILTLPPKNRAGK